MRAATIASLPRSCARMQRGQAQAAGSKGPASAEPIPSDLVYNAFFDDKNAAAKMVVATDGGVATIAAGALATGSTAKLTDPGADPKTPMIYAYSTKARTVTATLKMSASGAGQAAGAALVQVHVHSDTQGEVRHARKRGGHRPQDREARAHAAPGRSSASRRAQKDHDREGARRRHGSLRRDLARRHREARLRERARAARRRARSSRSWSNRSSCSSCPCRTSPSASAPSGRRTSRSASKTRARPSSTTVNVTLLARDQTTATLKVDATHSSTMAGQRSTRPGGRLGPAKHDRGLHGRHPLRRHGRRRSTAKPRATRRSQGPRSRSRTSPCPSRPPKT